MYCQDEHNNKKHPLASKDEKGGGVGPSVIDAGRDLMDPMALNRGRGTWELKAETKGGWHSKMICYMVALNEGVHPVGYPWRGVEGWHYYCVDSLIMDPLYAQGFTGGWF